MPSCCYIWESCYCYLLLFYCYCYLFCHRLYRVYSTFLFFITLFPSKFIFVVEYPLVVLSFRFMEDKLYESLIPFLLFIFFIVVQLQVSCLFPHYLPLPQTSYYHSHPPSLSVPMSSLFVSLCLPLLLLSPLSHIPLPSGHCQFVLYFHVSGSILLICLFCCLSSTNR